MQFASTQKLSHSMKSVPSYQSFQTYVRRRSLSGPREEEGGSPTKTALLGSIQGGGGSTKEEVVMSKRLWITILAVVLGSSLQFGYGTGVLNNSERSIRASYAEQGIYISDIEWSVTVSMFGAGGLIGCTVLLPYSGKHMGRKATLSVINIFVFISCSLLAFSSSWWMMAIGRIFIGMVAGVATGVVPIYFSEISPTKLRGAVGTLHQLGITLGILASQVLSTPSLNILGSSKRWRYLFSVPAACALLELWLLPFAPESPSYLYKTEGEDSARAALKALHTTKTGEVAEATVERYITNIAQEVAQEEQEELLAKGEDSEGPAARSQARSRAMSQDATRISLRQLFVSQELRKQLLVGLVIQLSMQFSGIDAVFYYSTEVFYYAGVENAPLATTLLGVINVCITIVAVRIMDSVGRRTLLLTSWAGMCCSYLLLTASFLLKNSISFGHQLSIVAMIGVIVFFAFGPGCIAWFIIAEIFPMYAKDTAMSLGVALNWAANWLVAFSFPHIQLAMGDFTFFLFAGTTAFFWAFTFRFVPETKGRTIREVTEEFARY